MISLKTKFAGLELDSPIILSASPITANAHNIQRAQEFGAGAVVLKSLFEEQILDQTYGMNHPEMNDYLAQGHTFEYLNLIGEAKKASTLPIIASINCHTANKWSDFARDIQAAGADALELNIMIVPEKRPGTQKSLITTAQEIDDQIMEIALNLKNSAKLPLIVKLSPYLSSIYDVANRLSYLGINGLTLFNRFFTPDMDINNLSISAKMNYSTPGNIEHGLRWTSILYNEINADLSASTGIYSSEDAIKMILAGSSSVQLCSVIYERGLKAITEINEGIHKWMLHHNYKSIEDFKGMMAVKDESNKLFTRMQFVDGLINIKRELP